MQHVENLAVCAGQHDRGGHAAAHRGTPIQTVHMRSHGRVLQQIVSEMKASGGAKLDVRCCDSERLTVVNEYSSVCNVPMANPCAAGMAYGLPLR
jgi:hypothetical protein